MAVYFLHVKIFSRANGSRATKAAAYRAGERIKDERTGDSYNHSDRQDVAYKEIVLPSELTDLPAMEWARSRSVLWNAAEHAGRLRNSRVAREVLVILPPELSAAQRTQLVRGFAQELSDKYRNAVDVAVHQPRAGSDERHHHAHLLMTTRQVGPLGMGARTTLELSGTERHALGLGPSKDDLLLIRERWAAATNDALREAGLSARVDHRSYRAQGIDREPQPVMPQSVFYSERQSQTGSVAGNAIRARHRERLEARGAGGDELEQVLRRQQEEGHRRALAESARKAALPKPVPRGSLTRDELNRQRREKDLGNREKINRQQRERRQANAAEVNRKQREYLKARTAARAAQRTPPPTAAPASTTPTAEQSAKNWLALRKRQGKDAEPRSAAEQWLDYRARQTPSASGMPVTGDQVSDRDRAPSGNEATPKKTRGPGNDVSL